MSTNSSRCRAPSTSTPDSTDSASQNLNSSFDGRPILPYTVGAKFLARRHEPPAPFGHGYNTPWPPFKTDSFRLPHIDYCIIRQPIEGRTLDESRTLSITDSIRTGYSYGAQLVVVNGDMVAKIYDPLYDTGSDCYDNKRDVVVLADGDYSREAAAYEELQCCPIARKYTPEYYGSWTTEVQTTIGDKTYTRHVRLILIEHITGTVMSSVAPQLLSRETRSTIMEKVLEAESFILNAGVWHRDMSPRNVMLVSTLPFSSSFDNPDLRVIIIDFNVSNVIRLSAASCYSDLDLAAIREEWPGKILGPVTRFWDAMAEFEVRDWVNDEFGKTNEWLWECFGQREEYVPLVRDWEDGEACPRIAWCYGLGDGGKGNGDTTVEDTLGNSGSGGGSDDEVVFRGRGSDCTTYG